MELRRSFLEYCILHYTKMFALYRDAINFSKYSIIQCLSGCVNNSKPQYLHWCISGEIWNTDTELMIPTQWRNQ